MVATARKTTLQKTHRPDAGIDLRSDTVTHPTTAMRQAMAAAIVGDDQYGEDATVNELEARAASLLGKEAAVFVPSGTMGNLASILAHCRRGDEAIVGTESHILWFEAGGPSTLGGVPLWSLRNDARGQYDLDELRDAIRAERPGYPRTGLICVENTHNRCCGAVLPMPYLRSLREIAQERGVPVHMDGARIFNAATTLGVPVAEIAAEADSVQFCLSKGLGAPVGSMVVGSADFIANVRRQRTVLGGAMRQAGVLAAAGLVAFDEMIGRLSEDHARAWRLAEGLAEIPGVEVDLEGVMTNIVVFKPGRGLDHAAVQAALDGNGLRVSNYGGRGLRIVTHYEIDDGMIETALAILRRTLDDLEVGRDRGST